MILARFAALALFLAGPALAALPAVTEADFTAPDFRFASGETLPALTQHYRTLGTPQRDAAGKIINAIMVLHGTGGTGAQFLVPQFADMLFGAGQPLDTTKYFIILPDAIGHGGSSRPSQGLKMAFPAYDYADMVRAQKALLDHLGIRQLRLLMGTSMGCMMGFQFGIDYTTPPLNGLKVGIALQAMASSAPLRMQTQWPTRAAADAAAATLMAQGLKTSADANDRIYQLDASRNYDPSPQLARITVPVTWINSADDFINPPNLGLAERDVKMLRVGKFIVIPETADTRGHSTHTWAMFWQDQLRALLDRSE